VRAYLALAALLVAPADPATDAFYAAAARARAGEYAQAKAAYEEVARRYPGHELADDALLEAAQLAEDRLSDPEAALALYQALVAGYPQSRLSRRAQARVDFLREGLAAGAEPLRRFEDIINHFPTRPRGDSIRDMEELLLRWPSFPLRARAHFWLGQAYQQEGRGDDAVRAYEDIRRQFPDTEWARRAEEAVGDVWLERGHFERAQAAYAALAGRGPDGAEAATRGLARLSQARRRRALRLGCLAVCGAVLLAYLIRAARGRRVRWPAELTYYLPVAGAFVGAAATEHRAIFRATALLAAVGAVLTFLVGQRPARRRIVHALALTVAVAATLVLAVEWQHLTDMLLETFQTGAER
jgi:TolA-binding protein